MFCITLHNIEEALWFTAWRVKRKPFGRKAPPNNQFVFAVLGVTALGYLTAGLHLLYPDNVWLNYAFIGFAGAMLINALAPHLLFTVIYRDYCPGVLTGCVFIMPFHAIIVINTVNENMTIAEVAIATVFVGLILLISIRLLELVAKRIFGDSSK